MILEIEVKEMTREEIVEILSCGLSGSYWCGVDNSTQEYKQAQGDCIEDKLAYMLLNGQSVVLYDIEEDDKNYELTLDKLYSAMGKYLKTSPNASIEDFDFCDGDNILQIALFGEVIYG